MSYLYNGFLSTRTADMISDMAKKYTQVVEIKDLPPGFTEWGEKNLKDYGRVGTDCMGERYEDTTKMYALVPKVGGPHDEKDTKFLFFWSKEEKDAFTRDFHYLVVNSQPFQTIIRL